LGKASFGREDMMVAAGGPAVYTSTIGKLEELIRAEEEDGEEGSHRKRKKEVRKGVLPLLKGEGGRQAIDRPCVCHGCPTESEEVQEEKQ